MDLFQSARISELEGEIKKHQNAYYNGEALISDEEFDALWDELKALDPDNPVLKKIGADDGNFAKVKHRMPMGSQEKAANPEEFTQWAEKHPYDEYLVEYKLDGASIELQYNKGVFYKAVTRGNGTIGDDITENVKKMQGLQPRLERNSVLDAYTGALRGEVIMTHDVHKTFFSDKANCRNAANGLMKRKDGEGSEHLQIICYDCLFDDFPLRDEEEKIKILSQWGFYTVPLKICHSIQEVIDYRAEVMEIRSSLPYDIDGLVIKERTVNLADASRARPDRQIAFKFSLEEAVSVLRGVEWSVSGSTYTPVGIFDPVELAGTKVKRASLVNPNTIRNLGVKIGSHVVVTKRGEIIPKIESVVPHEDISDVDLMEIKYPRQCEKCGSDLKDDGSRLYCPNKNCPKRILHRINKWIDLLDIRDFGTTLTQALFDNGVISSIISLYALTEEDITPYFLNEESIAKDKESLGAKKVIKSLLAHNTVSLPTFVAGFDIEGIGETLMEKLIEAGFSTLDSLLTAKPEDFAAVNGFGDITANILVEGLRENAEEMRRLIAEGHIVVTENSIKKLSGLSFCFTGELSIKRSVAEKMVKELGGSIKSSVVKGLSYLVTNDTTSGSAKNKKAQSLSIPVINEEEFNRLLQE